MDIDKRAAARIAELEDQLEEAYQLIDLLYEDKGDLQNELKAAKGQLALLRIDRKVAV